MPLILIFGGLLVYLGVMSVSGKPVWFGWWIFDSIGVGLGILTVLAGSDGGSGGHCGSGWYGLDGGNGGDGDDEGDGGGWDW